MSLLDAVESLDAYVANGGGDGLAAARVLGAIATIRELEQSGLHERAGERTSTANKWRLVHAQGAAPRRAIANGCDTEPGTFNNRAVIRANPYQVVEGLAVAALAIDTRAAYIAVHRSYTKEIERLRRAVAEMAAAGVLGDLTVTVVAGPDHYLLGDESALAAVVDGGDACPRPVAAAATLVSDVETLAHAGAILARGSRWFLARGTTRSPGTKVFTVSGDVVRPGVHELPLATPMRVLVDDLAGGTASGRAVKVVCSGVTNAVVPGERLDVALDPDALAEAGSGLAAGGFTVYGDDVCAVALARAYSKFLWVESCGQCPACKLGTGAITTTLARLERRGAADNLFVLPRALASVVDGRRCALPLAEQQIVGSLLRTFPADVRAHQDRACRLRHDVVVPHLVDLGDGEARYDTCQAARRPDWRTRRPLPDVSGLRSATFHAPDRRGQRLPQGTWGDKERG